MSAECALRIDASFPEGVFAYDVRADVGKVPDSRNETHERLACSFTDSSENIRDGRDPKPDSNHVDETARGYEPAKFCAIATPSGNPERLSIEHGEVSEDIMPSVSESSTD